MKGREEESDDVATHPSALLGRIKSISRREEHQTNGRPFKWRRWPILAGKVTLLALTIRVVVTLV